MSPEQQTPNDVGTVIEFGGTDQPASRPRARRVDVAGWAAGLAADRRLVPLAATLSGVALFASLVSEWQLTRLDAALVQDSEVGTRPLPATVADLGAWGAGYLIGVFLLVAATVLVLFGPGPGRPYARLVGLSAGGVLIGLLAAVGAELGAASRLLSPTFTASAAADQVHISYGRGLWCALFGVAAAMLALIQAGRHLPPPGPPAAPGAEVEPAAAPAVWSWRRPSDADAEPLPEEPFDLTVSSAKPFPTGADDRDKPS